MTFNEFLSDLKVEFRQYFDANLIDDLLVYKWVNQALKKFGATVMVYQDKMISVENNKAKLPENFFQLKAAILCEPDFIECRKEDEKILLNSFFWTDVTRKQKSWDICTEDCCENAVEEFTIREKTYMNECAITKVYKSPMELKLGKSFNKTYCAPDCLNKFASGARNEINIVGTTLHTNFKEGEIYLKYKGFEVDEEGLTIIPETPKGEVSSYVMIFVKRNILEYILANGEDTNIITLFQYYNQQAQTQLALALTDAKFSNLTPKSLYKLKLRPYLERQVFENRIH
jgi:hypothetical protein